MAKQWDNRTVRVLQFLDAYEKQESLWNPANESYKNKAARDEAYMQIIRELNVPSWTIHDIKLKVKSIRTTYAKELRLLTKHKQEHKPYTPKLFWFNRANGFLRNVSQLNKRSTHAEKANVYKPCVNEFIASEPHRESLNDDESLDAISHIEEDPHSSTYEYKTLPNADLESHIHDIEMTCGQSDEKTLSATTKQHIQQTENEELHQQIATTIVSPKYTITNETPSTAPSILVSAHATPITTTNVNNNTSESDEYDLFCRSVAAQLRGITDTYSRSVAKLKIQQILFEAETGHYRNSPCITIPVSQHISNI